jgi:hypothetical protein
MRRRVMHIVRTCSSGSVIRTETSWRLRFSRPLTRFKAVEVVPQRAHQVIADANVLFVHVRGHLAQVVPSASPASGEAIPAELGV